MHDVIEHRLVPHHVEMARERNGMPLVDFRGGDSAKTVKYAHWSGQLREVHTSPRDDYHTICFHESGASVRRSDMESVLTPGMAFLQAAEDEAVFNSDGQLNYSHLYLPVSTLQDLVNDIDSRPAHNAVVPVEFGCREAEFTRTLADSIALIRDAPSPSAIEFDEWTVDIGMALLRYVTRLEDDALVGRARSSLNPAQMSRVVDFIEAKIATRITLADLAEMCGISQFRFMRAFKAETGFNPHQYVIERRVARAKSLLQDSEDSIADIAYDIGFSSQAHMTDVFRKRVGATPGQFRRIMRE
ncbi:AraC family transcriptional regulator [uncultured Tateyamaria sp.]|uniref:AraC family transcriptional regulator n=1 Tax=uncultured Tateyamaria sp. TaxID=455651 RepID=UPI0026077AD4|nr:AraC family transcriptional regulator [uncultured Tateyamaria sp.]